MIQNFFKIIKLCNILIALLFSFQAISQVEGAATTDITALKFFNVISGNGINGASLAGGCPAIIYKSSSTTVAQYSYITYSPLSPFSGSTVGVIQTSDDAYYSAPANGQLQFLTAPCTSIISGYNYDYFLTLDLVTFNLGVSDPSSKLYDGNYNQPTSISPTGSAYTKLNYTRSFTPILHYLQQRVMYFGKEISFFIDPKQCQDYRAKTALGTNAEKPFLDVQVNGYSIDTSPFWSSLSSNLATYNTSQVRGVVKLDDTTNPRAPIAFQFRCGYALLFNEATQTSYDNSISYEAKVVPSILKIDNNCGSSAGGQIITITGGGFMGQTIDIKIDGVPCVEDQTFRTTQRLVCEAGPNPTPSNQTYYVGSPGIRRSFFNSIPNFDKNPSPKSESLDTGMETPFNQQTSSGNLYRGLFRPPATAQYKFYMSCDDSCNLSLSTDQNPKNKTLILSVPTSRPYRGYFTVDGSQNTSWIPLIGGNYYYIETTHTAGSGDDHLSVAVEIQGNQILGHQQSMREIQRFQINPTNIREKIVFNITGYNGNAVTLNLKPNPLLTDPSFTRVINIPVNPTGTASDFQTKMQNQWYSNFDGATISVTQILYDSQNKTTNDSSLANMYSYVITVNQALNTGGKPSIQSFGFTRATGLFGAPLNAKIQVSFGQLSVSSVPLSGSFLITCASPGGTTNTTASILTNSSTTAIKRSIEDTCKFYRDKLYIWDGPLYKNYFDGRDIFIRFVSYNGDPDQFIISQPNQLAITGGSTSLQNAFVQQTFVPYSSNLFYEPVPYEMLFTNETTPQVEVTVDGVRAVCATPLSSNCGYQMCNSDALITNYSKSGLTIVIEGINLKYLQTKVTFAYRTCTVNIFLSSPTKIVCYLISNTAGYWYPIVQDNLGYVTQTEGLQPLFVPLKVDSVHPNTTLNNYGGKGLTIFGNNFPVSLKESQKSNFSITFDDGSICELEITASTFMYCITQEYQGDITNPVTMCIFINNLTDCSLQVTFTAPEVFVTSITPSVASPVLPAKITIKIYSDYLGNLALDDLSAKIIEKTNSSHVRQLRVVSVDNVAKTLTVKYNGIEPGVYSLQVTSKFRGNFNTSGITFTSIGIITDYNPKNGSMYGGTLITITGYNFSNALTTDNAVQIGSTPCNVLTTSFTQITCMTQEMRPYDPYLNDVIVFLRTFYEADCKFGVGNCTYTWLQDQDLPSLSYYSVAFDTNLNDYVITLVGTRFPSDPSQVQFYVDGVAQKVISASESQIKITISGMLDYFSNKIQFYLPSGIPSGAGQLNQNGILLTPVFVSVQPNLGSSAGSIITAIVKGVGVNTANVNIATNQSASFICASVKVPSYGVVKCTTRAITVSPSILRVQAINSSLFYDCANTSLCSYQTSTSYPNVLSQSFNTTDIIFYGQNFFTSGFNASVSLKGMLADKVSIDSATQVTATWVLGIPVLGVATAPSLWFDGGSALGVHWASNTKSFQNNLIVTQIDNQVTCSFEGGCQISISQIGVTSAIQSGYSYVTVCEKKAVLSSLSTPSQAIFTLPALQTTYSMQYLNVTQQQSIVGTAFSSETSASNTNAPWDGITSNGFLSYRSPCNFGTSFSDNYIGLITQVRVYMNFFTQSSFVGKLRFQGSMDKLTYNDIFVVGTEIHEGWNYYEFPGTKALKYQHYRFYSNGSASTCNIGEVILRGLEVINDPAATHQCSAKVYVDGNASPFILNNQVTYDANYTPLLLSVSPRFGPVQGGTNVTFTFKDSNFSTNASLYTITIDGIVCQNATALNNQVTCITGKRPGLVNSSLSIFVKGKGLVSTQGIIFRYMNYWSNPQTWGDDFIPADGESIVIPQGLNLLVDIDKSPLLNAIDVQGSLVFAPNDTDPTYLKTFDANIIIVKGGTLEIGTEAFPYTSQLIITMHGEKYSPGVPIFGNKAIGVYGGTVDIHGVPRSPTWTELLTTANINDTTITLKTAVDWKAGEQVVIAPSSYNNKETEVRTIIQVDNTKPNQPVITLDSALEFLHFAGIDQYGLTDFIEMRSEVGLLTRNIIFRGDPQTSPINKYGASIMLYSSQEDSLIGRIEYVELQYVGQAYQIGQYPIVFHMNGDGSQSYVRGTSIHDSYNRAIALSGIYSLTLDQNVIFMVLGHAIFFENAAETKNVITNNLVMRVHSSWSLLNTDTTPACFWITHPDNIFRGNHAVGSDGKGFWFESQSYSRGYQTSANICPQNSQLAEFTNNVAHSNLQHGLQIYHSLIPRRDQCLPIVYDSTNAVDPYWKNPIITAQFVNFTSWKNIQNGAVFERIGDVRLINFKVADNLIAGIEVSLTVDTADGTAQINNALVIGQSVNAEPITMNQTSRGIITPRSDNFQVNGANFYRFSLTNQSAFGTCSQCQNPYTTDSGARTVTTSGLFFDNSTVARRIIYNFPQRDIFYDTDGTLTFWGPNTFASYYYNHNNQPECDRQDLILNGIRCNSSVQIRRVAFSRNQPSQIFSSQPINILKYDDFITSPLIPNGIQNYTLNISAYSRIPFRSVSDLWGWAVPYVTGHKYKVSFGSGPLDWTYLIVEQSAKWQYNDSTVYFVMNFTDVRAEVNVTAGGDRIKNYTLSSKSPANWTSGDNDIMNDTNIREIRFVINGKNQTRSRIVMTGARCAGGPCIDPLPAVVPMENKTRRWSVAQDWSVNGSVGVVPKENDTVTIQQGWNMIYDVNDSMSPILNYLEIDGILTFENNGTQDLTLRSRYIFVRAGQLVIGNKTNPFLKNANIILYGEYSSREIVFASAVEAGNKILANTNLLSFYGRQRSSLTRLRQTAYKGNNSILVEKGLDWTAGDKIAIAPNTLQAYGSDYGVIVSYDTYTGIATLDRKLNYYHWGQDASTETTHKIDMRAEVVLLSRNIKIQGDVSSNSWGCSVLTSDFSDGKVVRKGSTFFDNVEIFNCSQYDTLKAALRFDGAKLGKSSITSSSIYFGWGMGITITSSSNIFIQSTSIYSFVRFGVLIESRSKLITLDKNILFQVYNRKLPSLDLFVDITAGISACGAIGNDACTYSITNNIVAASTFAGYVVYGHECGNYTQQVFRNNFAHSIDGSGAVIFPDPSNYNQQQCMEGSFFYAYKNRYDGAVSSFAVPNIKYSNMIFVDNGIGPNPIVGMEGDSLSSVMNNITIWGESLARDCPYQGYCTNNSASYCVNRTGFMLPMFVDGGKLPMPTSYADLPMYINNRQASFGGNINATGMNFRNFTSNTTWCGNTQVLFGLNDLDPDYQPKTVIYSSVFENIHDDAFAYFYTPPQSWFELNQCGDWPCSGPNNTYLRMENAQFTGAIKPTSLTSYTNFQLTPLNAPGIKNFTSCTPVSKWNTYQCQNDALAILLFESLDFDKWSRTASPITISQALIQSSNTINSFMDHGYSGTSAIVSRLSRWPSIIQVGSQAEQLVSYTGTPPKNQRFKLITDSLSGATIITIRYPKAAVYNVQDQNGNLIQANNWNDTLRGVNPIKRSYCGENRYVGVANILQFYLTRNCLVQVVPSNSIYASIRLNWTLDEFYLDGGSTTFSDRISASLGVKSYDIKVVAVYQGSVICNVTIQDSGKKYGSLKLLSLQLIRLINFGQLNVGAPVISANIGYAPIIIPSATSQQTNSTGINSKIIVTNLNGTVTVDSQSSSDEGGLSSKMLIIILGSLAGILLIGAGLIGYWFYRKNMLRLKQVQDGEKAIDQLDEYAKIRAMDTYRSSTMYLPSEYDLGRTE